MGTSGDGRVYNIVDVQAPDEPASSTADHCSFSEFKFCA